MLEAWDAIDAALLAAAYNPVTLDDLIDATGCPGNVVKGLIDAHIKAGRLTRLVTSGVRYQATIAGRAHLLGLTPKRNPRTAGRPVRAAA